MTKTKRYAKPIYVLVALVLALSLMLVPAAAKPAAANPDGVTVTLDVSFSGQVQGGRYLEVGWTIAPDLHYYDHDAAPAQTASEFTTTGGTYQKYTTSGSPSASQTLTLSGLNIGDEFEIDALVHADNLQTTAGISGNLDMTVSASGAVIEPVFGQWGAPEYDVGDLTFFYTGLWPCWDYRWWDESGDMSSPGIPAYTCTWGSASSGSAEARTTDDWSQPFDGSDHFIVNVATTADYGDSSDAFARVRVRYRLVESVIEVEIDIKPGSDPNSINLGSNGVVPVAILGSADFDASTVDPFSVKLAGATVRVKGKSGNAGSLEDVNGDGYPDLVVQVYTIDFAPGDGIADLTGLTYDGVPIHGTDSIRIVPPE